MAVDIDLMEERPLLSLPSEDPKKGWTKAAIRTAFLLGVFLFFGTIGEVFKTISSVRLIELGFCREHYLGTDPSVIDSHGRIPESLCKSPDIQQKLAHLRGSLGALEAIVGLVLTIPYGLLVNRVGERLLGAVNLFGFTVYCAWFVMVCYFWQTFPIWTAVFGPLFRSIGGSTPVMASLMYSMLAKHVPEANRSICFFFLGAVQLSTEILAVMGAASFMDHQYLFTPMLLIGPIVMLLWVVLYMIPPNPTIELDEDNQVEGDEAKLDLLSSVRQSIHLMAQIIKDKNVVLLLLTVPIASLRNPIAELWLQYIPKKFGLTLAAASRVITIQSIESLILLILVIPSLKEIAQVRYNAHSNKVDLRIVQFSFFATGIGSLVMALGQHLTLFITGLLTFTLGVSLRPCIQSVLTDLVRREQIAVLYTIIAVGDGVGAVFGSLVLNRSLAIAIGWEDQLWLGLPFLIATGVYLTGFLGSLGAGHAALEEYKEDESERDRI